MGVGRASVRRAWPIGLAALIASCTSPLTELVVVVHPDLPLDAIELSVNSEAIDGRMQEARLPVGESPGSLGVVHQGGPLGPVQVRAVGLEGERAVVEQAASVFFVAGESRRLDLFLGEPCRDVSCPRFETCVGGACVDEDRETELWDGVLTPRDAGPPASSDAGPMDSGPPDAGLLTPDGGPPPDAGPDACVSTPEVCNGRDDDCDLSLDEGVVSVDDPLHCGTCGRACAAGGACDGRSCEDDAVAVAIFEGGACAAVGPTRQVHCWGLNNRHQFGDGTTDASNVPVPNGLTDVTQLAAGDEHVCALRSDGTVHCWGRTDDGRLGHAGDGALPELVSLPTTATSIAAGADFSCALLLGGQVYCWGHNNLAQCGQPISAGELTTPTATSVTNAVALGLGELHGCAALADSSVVCWGRNHVRQADPTSDDAFFPEPRTVAGVSDTAAGVAGVGGGVGHSCALFGSGRLHCWGQNGLFQLARDPTSGAGPHARDLLEVPLALSVGDDHACVLERDGGVVCWGANDVAQLGRPANTPRSIADPTQLTGGPYRAVVAGYTMTCGRADDGGLECRGRGYLGDDQGLQTTPAAVRAMLP